MVRDTLLDYFDDLAEIRAPYLVYDDGFRARSYTYAEVAAAARGFAARLHAAGLVKGDHAIVWSENRPEWIAEFWGCIRAGLVVVPQSALEPPAMPPSSSTWAGSRSGVPQRRLVLRK